jgi:hypothetical protein
MDTPKGRAPSTVWSVAGCIRKITRDEMQQATVDFIGELKRPWRLVGY